MSEIPVFQSLERSFEWGTVSKAFLISSVNLLANFICTDWKGTRAHCTGIVGAVFSPSEAQKLLNGTFSCNYLSLQQRSQWLHVLTTRVSVNSALQQGGAGSFLFQWPISIGNDLFWDSFPAGIKMLYASNQSDGSHCTSSSALAPESRIEVGWSGRG